MEAAVAHGVRDHRVLSALHAIPRAEFVSHDLARLAYVDRPLPIAYDQVTTQPSLIAQMLAGLALRGGERVLEVGTGHGFQTALLAFLAAEVWSVERHADLAATARGNLDRAGIANANVVVGDGSAGLPDHAPFDRIVVSAAFTRVPEALSGQLTDGGLLVVPIGPGGAEDVVLFQRKPQGLEHRALLTRARFVRLYGRHAFPPPGTTAQ